MRVISKCGKYDLPYENFVFICERTMIYAVSISGSGTKQWLIAQYETPEKAEKAMESLLSRYDSIEFMKCCHSEETFSTMRNILSSEDFDKATSSCFKFPADDEIEVEE